MMNRLEPFLDNCREERLKHLLTSAVKAGLSAGRVIMERFEQPHDIRQKGEIDLVTEADVAAEDKIKEILCRAHPDVKIMAEESAEQHLNARHKQTWIIDPLDGTTNFAHGFPWFAVSIAYMANDLVLAGIIYQPITDELFYSIRNHGAWLNSKRITVSTAETLKKSLLATGFPYDVHQKPDKVIGALSSLLTKCQGIRRAGAAALDLAYLACGRLDGFWEINLKPWDTAAGQLLVEEAGGKLTTFDGAPYTPFIPEIMASNGHIHAAMQQNLTPFSSLLDS